MSYRTLGSSGRRFHFANFWLGHGALIPGAPYARQAIRMGPKAAAAASAMDDYTVAHASARAEFFLVFIKMSATKVRIVSTFYCYYMLNWTADRLVLSVFLKS